MNRRGMFIEELLIAPSEIQRRYLSIVVNDDFVEKTINAILKSAATDQVGDGKIFVLPCGRGIQNSNRRKRWSVFELEINPKHFY
jgi:nitrogen regulatory protein P-II 1